MDPHLRNVVMFACGLLSALVKRSAAEALDAMSTFPARGLDEALAEKEELYREGKETLFYVQVLRDVADFARTRDVAAFRAAVERNERLNGGGRLRINTAAITIGPGGMHIEIDDGSLRAQGTHEEGSAR